ncbi:unnamed protein product [Adineta steineri]|uniref:ZZ-type domain-containing protein n=1 Tax=Adineta steineri TaxID=433720 RepID=A0A814X8D8_9BILA|nr:unnamed protein product [Adineta steineri]
MNTNFSNELQQLQMELRAQNFDIIRFSTYRTACKLRFIQKKLNFHLLDLLNVAESLRESLKSLSSETTPNHFISNQSCLLNNNKFLSINHLTIFLTSIYTNLNKRLPLSQQILHIDKSVQSAIAWFLYVYNINNVSIRFNSFRVVLILLCTGKLVDKLRHLFTSYFSTSLSNTLTHGQIDELLHEVLALPYALKEISHSTYCKNYSQSIFSQSSSSITLNDFLDILVYNDKTPNCLQWLIVFHRLISVENVIHRVKCSACQRPSFSGFRYKCQQCHNRTYQLCQDCFWRGRTSNQHLSTHEMKEYTYFTSPNKDFRQSIRKSLQCMPKNEKRNQLLSPLTVDKEQQSTEHTDISLYTKRLASFTENENSTNTKYCSRKKYNDNQNAEKKLLISKLEAENRRILHEINTLRAQLKFRSLDYLNSNDYDTDNFSTIEQQYSQTLPNRKSNIQHDSSSYPSNYDNKLRRAGSVETTNKNCYIEDELRKLLARKYHLESRIDQLQQSREELTTQLDNLGRILHDSTHLRQRSATSSPYTRSCVSPSRINSQVINSKNISNRSYSTPTTPIHNQFMNYLHTDLLLAADSLTSALSTLVQHLNTKNTEPNQTTTTATVQTLNEDNSYPYENGNPANTDDYLLATTDNDNKIFNSTSINKNV